MTDLEWPAGWDRTPTHERGRNRGPDAGRREVQRAFQEKAKEVHPDRGGTTEAFAAVQEARDRLLNGPTEAGRP